MSVWRSFYRGYGYRNYLMGEAMNAFRYRRPIPTHLYRGKDFFQ